MLGSFYRPPRSAFRDDIKQGESNTREHNYQ